MNKTYTIQNKNRDSIATIIHLLYYAWVFCVFAFSDSVTVYANSVALALIGVCGIWIIQKKRIHLPKNNLLLFLFVVYGFISCIWSINKSTSITRATSTLILFTLYLVISVYAINSGDRSFLINSMMVVANVLCMYVVLIYGTGFISQAIRYGSLERVGQEFVNSNALGMILAYGSVVALFEAFIDGKYRKVVFAVVPVVFSFLTGSRKAIMIMALGIVVISFLKLKESKKQGTNKGIRRLMIFIIVVGALFALYYSSIGDLVRLRMGGLLAKGSARDFSTIERERLIRIGIQRFYNNPIFGCGIGASDILTGGTYFHNNYVELLTTTGLMGFLLYYLYYLKNYLTYHYRIKNKTATLAEKIGYFFCIVLFLVDFGSVAYFSKTTYMVLIIISAFYQSEGIDSNQEEA